MKSRYLFFIISMRLCSSVFASTLDGTSGVIYTDVHHVFHDGEYAKGFVALDDGFTVLAGASASLDILSPVDGGIDLREYGVLELDGDVTLDSQVSFSSGGHIAAEGAMLSLNGNLAFPSTRTVHCKGSLCLNGNGKTVMFDKHAQLFLDQNSTLTLKNMVIKTKPYEAGVPALTISSSSSKLCLDNVVLQLGGDFYVNNGQIFFHNDVVVTGTKAFVYRSGEPSFIAKNSCLYFDIGTTFSYVPTAANPSLIFCADETSQLFFNGSSLKTSFTGMQVTKGSLLFDNDVLVDSFADDVVNDFGLLSGDIATSRTVAWSPRGNVIASVSSSNTLAVYRYNGTSWTVHGTKNLGGRIHHIAWSPDGRWVCALREVVHSSSSEITYSTTLYLERYYQTTGLSSTEEYTVVFDGIVTSLDWSTDGDYLAVAHSEYDTGVPSWTHQLRVYSFDGTAISLVGSGIDIGAMALSIAWNPHGRYIALAGAASSSELRLYSFNGTGIAHVQSVDMSGRCKLCTWSPDGRYLVVCRPSLYGDDYVNGIISTFNFTAGALSSAGDAVTLTQFVPYSMEFSPCGKFIAMAGGQQYEMTPENISFARYGAGSNYNDVTSSLKYNTLVYGCLNKYTSTYLMFGDPIVGTPKALEITYAGIPSAYTSGYTFIPSEDTTFTIQLSGALRLYYFNKHGIAASYLEQVTFSGKVACDGHFNPSGNLMSIANPKNSWSLFNLFHTSTNTNYAYDSQSALVMGDGTAASDVAVTLCSGASVHVHGNMIYNPS